MISDSHTAHEVGFRLAAPQAEVWTNADGRWMQCRIVVEGEADPARVRSAVRSVLDRHESLRSRLLHLPNITAPLQIVDETEGPDWHEAELPAAPAEAAAAVVDLAVRGDRSRFLGRGADRPVVRIFRSPARLTVLMTASTMFVDVGSLKTIFGDLAAALREEGSGEPPLQYLDAAQWLDEQAACDEAAEQMNLWNHREIPAAHLLPIMLEPGDGAGEGRVRVRLDASLADDLDQAAARIGCSVASMVMSAWYVLLWRLGGRPDEVAAALTPAARGLDELDEVVGRFDRPVPVIVPMPAEQRFESLVRNLEERSEHAEGAQFYLDAGAFERPFPFTFRYTELPPPVEFAGGTVTLAEFDLASTRSTGMPTTRQ